MKPGIFLIAMVLIASCSKPNKFDEEFEKGKILKLHHLQRAYHFNKDSIAFANQFSENFTSVNKGVISKPQKKERISKYHHYFSSVEFVKWDDVAEPIIRFSADGTLAYTIVDKIVEITYKNDNGEPQTEETHFAWTTIYKKYGEDWKIDAVISTERPAQKK